MEPSRRPVTHVFTDIEGSTRLWESEPDRMAAALAAHDELAKRIVGEHAGLLVRSTGDGWHAAFDDPLDALRAACEFEMELPGVGQSAGVSLASRCAIHAGFAESRGGDFFGGAVNRTARIMSAAHGGQVLVSQAAADLVANRLSDGLSLRELGRVRLRDLGAERVYQLEHPALRRDFPPLRGLDATPNNLPVVASSFVGRIGALAELAQALASHRVVTITGPGGIGKTTVALHLAAEVLERFDDGVWFVELANVEDPAQVDGALAQALGVREPPDKPLADSIADFVAERKLLVLLDNCEQVLAACAARADALLRRSAHARIVATSREPLRIEGESVYALPALAVPQRDDDLAAADAGRSPAVALFVERACDQAPGFALTDRNAPTIAKICRRLDGMPLAIELAAARARSLALDDLERRLDDRFHLLTGGYRTSLPRHRTLEALVAWSYDLLDERERALFDRLGVFVGGFDLEAAEAVAASPPLDRAGVLDLLGSLVEKSLVVADAGDDGRAVRYRLLETLRAFALARLDEGGDADGVRHRHAEHYTRLGCALPAETEGEARGRYLLRLDADADNLRAAVAYRLAEPGTGEAALELVHAFVDFCELRGHHREALRVIEAALARPVAATPSLARAKLARDACFVATLQARLGDARRLGDLALSDFRLLGKPTDVASMLERLGEIAGYQNDFDTAIRLSEEALAIFRAEGDRVNEGKALVNLGTTCSHAGQFERARDFAERGIAVAREVGHLGLEAYAELLLAAIDIESDHPARAREHYQKLLPLAQRVGDRHLETLGRGGIAQVELALGNFDVAHPLSLEVLAEFAAGGLRREMTYALDDIAYAHASRGDRVIAARLFAAAERERDRTGARLAASEAARLDGRIAAARGAAPAAFDAAWVEGEAMSLEEAVGLARRTPLRAAADAAPSIAAPAHR